MATSIIYINGEPTILKSRASTYQTLEFMRQGGSLYHSIHRGSFGYNRDVLVKKALLREKSVDGVLHDELLHNDRTKTELLQYHPSIARFLFYEIFNLSALVYMENYVMNLGEYVSSSVLSTKNYSLYEPVSIKRQLLESLIFLASHNVLHRDLQLKNMFIHSIGGKSTHMHVHSWIIFLKLCLCF